MRFFRNATKNTGDTRAFLQERAQKYRETLARFFRNAPKNSARHSCVSSGTQLKYRATLVRFVRNATKNTRRHKKFRETLVRFFRNAPKNLARHSCVSSGTRPKIQRTAIAFLERTRPKNSVKHVRVSSNDASKNASILERNIFEKRYLPEKKFKLVRYLLSVLLYAVELCYKFIVPEIETISS